MTHNAPSIQRTLVLTSGDLGQQVAAVLHEALTAVFPPITPLPPATQPCPSVSIVHLADTTPETYLPEIDAALTHISQAPLHKQLAAYGWHLSHSSEVTLILVADSRKPIPPALVTTTQRLIQEQFGSSYSTLRLTLALNPNQATIPPAPPGERGHYLLSSLNQLGLQIPAEEIAPRTAQILIQLITTYRHAPEYMQEQSHYLERANASVGITSWSCATDYLKQRLGQRWLTAVLHQWQAPVSQAPAQADGWFAQQAIMPKQITPHLAALSTPIVTPAWHPPLPWHIPGWVARQKQLAHMLQMPEDDLIVQIEPEMEALLAPFTEAVYASCQTLLDEMPAAGAATVQQFLAALNQQLGLLGEQTAVRQETLSQTAVTLAQQSKALLAQMEQQFIDWPGDNPARWVKPLLQPWHWPTFIWGYWQLHTMGQHVCHLLHQQAQQEWEQVTTAVLHHLYTRFGKTIAHVTSQADELDDMLNSFAQRLIEPDGDTFPALQLGTATNLIDTLYNQIIESPRLEAAAAAAIIGGLGQQLRFPNDAIFEKLQQFAQERLAAIEEKTAVDLLLLHHPSRTSLLTWWETQLQEAAPLWKYDETSCGDYQRSQINSLTLVATADALRLRDQLQLPNEANIHWLPNTDTKQIIILRLQGGIPIPPTETKQSKRNLS